MSLPYGARFTAEHWFDRLIIALNDGGGRDLPVRIYDSPDKTNLIQETLFINVGSSRALHMIFEPLPPGEYFWELDPGGQVTVAQVYITSTYKGAYVDGNHITGYDFRSKIMYCTDELQERAVAITGDPIDHGATQVKEGSGIMAVQVGTVEKNVAKELDELNNGGRILTGSWYVETA
ncbi:MAG: hypothetical protein Q8J68_08995 [Methanolobus sp.]|uniref:hypothetical protein n=1 Tax=Methanolobus sp. TaxID=1874737 RepID=UPI002730E757|nr:hypothetical protein [Methanolobus sp.]MDP2217409.1 hypothetical protein [Methanolobus sp.]